MKMMLIIVIVITAAVPTKAPQISSNYLCDKDDDLDKDYHDSDAAADDTDDAVGAVDAVCSENFVHEMIFSPLNMVTFSISVFFDN